MQKSGVDVSEALSVTRIKGGVKLVRPAKAQTYCSTVADVLQLPCSVYFENENGEIHTLNEHNVAFCGFASRRDAIGKNYFRVFTPSTAEQTIYNDQKAMRMQTMQMVDEIVERKDGDNLHTFSIKFPWYNENDQVIGLFGLSLLTTEKTSFSMTLKYITEMGLLLPTQHDAKSYALTNRQRQCVEFLLQGKTCKEIANELSLSVRTIEGYMDVLKTKFHCRNKLELIAKLTKIMN